MILGNKIIVSYFYGINPAQAENPIFFPFMFQGPKRRQKNMENGAKESSKRSPEGQKGLAHAIPAPGRVGPLSLALGSPFVRFLRSYALFLPKTDARKFPGHLDVVWVPETSKYRK